MKFVNFVKRPYIILIKLLWLFSKHIKDDIKYSKLEYFISMGKKLNLQNPKTFNEKLQWLKLNYFIEKNHSKYVDKILAKNFVSKTVGDKYIIKTLGIWNNFEDINFDELPNEFVLKCTHDSGGVVICNDKKTFDIDKAYKIIKKSFENNYYLIHREAPYKYIEPKIIAEEFLVDESGYELKDYKIFCFNGKPKFLFIATERPHNTKFNFFDVDFNPLKFKQGHPVSKRSFQKPKNFEKMLNIATRLSKGFPQVRIDLYNINGEIYFGELTFTHFAGIIPFKPNNWDLAIGEWLDISSLIKVKQ